MKVPYFKGFRLKVRFPASSYPTFEVIPTGELILKTGKYSINKEWRDSKIRLEAMLPQIIIWMESKAREWALWREQTRIEKLELKKQQEIVAAGKALREQEMHQFEDLLQNAQRFTKARELREYITAREQKAIQEGRLSTELQQWILWARGKADWYDPLVDKEDPLLGRHPNQ